MNIELATAVHTYYNLLFQDPKGKSLSSFRRSVVEELRMSEMSEKFTSIEEAAQADHPYDIPFIQGLSSVDILFMQLFLKEDVELAGKRHIDHYPLDDLKIRLKLNTENYKKLSLKISNWYLGREEKYDSVTDNHLKRLWLLLSGAGLGILSGELINPYQYV